MTVRAIGDYDFPSADRAENFGDDQLVYVHWEGNLALCAAATFRAPKAMPWSDFCAQMVDPWAGSDPDYDPAAPKRWRHFEDHFTPDPQATLSDLGIGHKSLLAFSL
jgi:phenol hydroxylase P4 protein